MPLGMRCFDRYCLAGRRYPTRFGRASRATVAAIVVVGCEVACADQGLVPYVTAIPRLEEASTLTFAVFQVERYDSNFFRLPDDVSPSDSSRRGGLTSITGVGLNLDKSYGLQRVVLNASTSRELYSHGDLNDTGTRVESVYYWSVTPSLSGNLTFAYARVPTDYEYLGFVTRPNPRTTRDTRLNIDFKPGAAFHPRLTLYESRATSQDTTFQLSNSRQNGAEVALLYDFASGNRLGVYGNRASGRDLNDNVNLFPVTNQDFRQNEYGVLAEWKSTGLSMLTGRLGVRNYSGRTSSSADFDGLVGNLKYTYGLTGKTRLNLSATRELFSAQTTFSTYGQEDTLSANLEWSVTGKLTFRPQYAVRRQDYRGASTPGTAALKETTHYATLQLDWAALRAVDFAVSVTHSNRTSNVSLLEYTDNSASVFARFKF